MKLYNHNIDAILLQTVKRNQMTQATFNTDKYLMLLIIVTRIYLITDLFWWY